MITVQSILDIKGCDVVTTLPDMTVSSVASLLVDHKIGAAVVTGKEGEIRGIVSERDIVSGVAEKGPDVLSRPVHEIMTAKVSVCHPGDRIEEVMATMTEARFRHFPVVEDGQLKGIISIGDVVKSRLEDLEEEAHVLRDYIAAY